MRKFDRQEKYHIEKVFAAKNAYTYYRLVKTWRQPGIFGTSFLSYKLSSKVGDSILDPSVVGKWSQALAIEIPTEITEIY